MKREEILESARTCVCTDRNKQYGEPEDNFKAIAEMDMMFQLQLPMLPSCLLNSRWHVPLPQKHLNLTRSSTLPDTRRAAGRLLHSLYAVKMQNSVCIAARLFPKDCRYARNVKQK